jgi:hypothetical protein
VGQRITVGSTTSQAQLLLSIASWLDMSAPTSTTKTGAPKQSAHAQVELTMLDCCWSAMKAVCVSGQILLSAHSSTLQQLQIIWNYH